MNNRIALPEGVQPPESGCVTVESGCSDGNVFAGKGARGLSVNEHGELVVETALGPVKFTKPVAYQEIEGKRVEVAVEYIIREVVGNEMESRGAGEQGGGGGLRDQNPKAKIRNPKSETQNQKLTYGFTVASYDKTKDIVIDPLLASTFLGGAGDDSGYAITRDSSGNVYVTGSTNSRDFPATSGAYDTTISSQSPASGATGVALTSTITAAFSESMNSSSITTSTFTVNNGANNISGSVS